MVPDPVSSSAEPRIPGYRIEGVLGRGATGTVYRARQVSVDREVALKVLHPDLVGTRAERRLQREARTTARLAHPNIISAIDMGEVDGRWWYAMERVDGESLLERIRERPLNEREALRLFIPLCDALQHAFERGVVHRDIKPANILIERGGRALIVDLGLAAAEDDPSMTKGGGTLGTPHYISPEQARDPKTADVQSDLWSLGATLYHAVCGRPPFRGDSVAEILSNVLYTPIDDPRELAGDLTAGLVLVLRKCLTRDRKHRYATPAELMADLERLRERRAPQVEERGLDPLARRPAPARRWSYVAGGVLLVAIASWLVLRGRPSGADSSNGAPQAASDDPLDAVARAIEGESIGLASAWDGLTKARGEGAEGARALRVADLDARLAQRFEAELAEFRRVRGKTFHDWITARDFDSAAEFLAGGARHELAKRLGSRTLPEPVARELGEWTGTLAPSLDEARHQAQAAYTTAVDRWWTERFLPQIARWLSGGDWRRARAALLAGSSAAIADATLDARGISADQQRETREALQSRIDVRRGELDRDWNALDGELRTWPTSASRTCARAPRNAAWAAPPTPCRRPGRASSRCAIWIPSASPAACRTPPWSSSRADARA